MNIRKKIVEVVELSIKNLQNKGIFSCFDVPNIQILKPKDEKNGDYSLSIAMEVAKIEKLNPMEVAESIRQELIESAEMGDIFSTINAVNPGFINFYFARSFLNKEIIEILKIKNSFGDLDLGKGKKIQVEFVSANPTGPLTVGNGRGGPFGDVLANVLKKAGYQVEKAYYVNDYGNQILSLGHSVLRDDDAKYSGAYIDELAEELKGEVDPYRIGKESARIVLGSIRKTVNSLNICYDDWFSESILYEKGLVDEVVDYLKNNNHTYEKDDALWFKSSDYGDERDRVIVKSNGSKTYLTGDLAYHKYKFDKKGFDRVINVWGADHYGDVSGLMAGIEAMGYERSRLNIILLQFVTVMKEGKAVKMSKRLGTAITMDDLLDELPVDVIRFFFLQKSANTHLNFDINLAKEQSDKNPVFYIQYAYARICSILKSGNIHDEEIGDIKNIDLLVNSKEVFLMREILRFPEVIEDTANDYQVHRLPQYSLDLATAFHQFYNECHCLIDDVDLREARLGLLVATKINLKNVLNLMGISIPDKM